MIGAVGLKQGQIIDIDPFTWEYFQGAVSWEPKWDMNEEKYVAQVPLQMEFEIENRAAIAIIGAEGADINIKINNDVNTPDCFSHVYGIDTDEFMTRVQSKEDAVILMGMIKNCKTIQELKVLGFDYIANA